MRDVRNIALQAPNDRPKLNAPLQGIFTILKPNRMEISRQSPKLRHFLRRTDKKLFALLIKPRQRFDHISNIGADAEFRHATDIEGDFHKLI